ncbi:MAG: DUF1287 domain-containing protein [Candidatus Methylacidiphilales bacterium]|nr:DUF1287 domain-containing protein [Candidatus Methylacidiphilales bacterium]
MCTDAYAQSSAPSPAAVSAPALSGKPSVTRQPETQAQKELMQKLIQAAEKRPSYTVTYDPTYFILPYPGGDPPADKGVCTDEVVRCYRQVGIDLQKEVHEDMKANFSLYPKKWGLKKADTNIDHRRVPNLMVYFKRQGAALPVTDNPADYQPGDLVTWNLRTDGDLPHIGIVVTTVSPDGQRHQMVHNIGEGPKNEDMLMTYKITGHYRYYGPNAK